MNSVESRQLRYFVAVAEELNFARAAERIGIASPALSRAISGLERELGVRLLDRSTRRVSLTGAGATLLADARTALESLDAAVLRARRAEDVPGGKLVLAVKADVEGGLLEDVLEAYRSGHPAVPIEVMFTGWLEQPSLLRSGEADVAIIVEPFDSEGLDTEPLLSEPQFLAVPVGHPLAELPRLRMADIEAEHQAMAPGSSIYVPHGAQRPHFGDMMQMLRQIELGRMLGLFPASLAERNARPQLIWRAVDDAPRATFALAWPQNSHSLAVADLVRIAATVSAARDISSAGAGGTRGCCSARSGPGRAAGRPG